MRADEQLWPMSYEQERLWFIDRWAPGLATYHVPVRWRLRPGIPVPEVVTAVRAVLVRHGALFTQFAEVDGAPMQRLPAVRDVPVAVHDLTGVPVRGRGQRCDEIAGALAVAPFDLAHGPLVRMAVIGDATGATEICVCFHHIAIDGLSLEIVERQVAAALAGAPLPAAPDDRYLEHCVEQRRRLAGPEAAALLARRAGELRDAPAVLELGRDHPRPRNLTDRGRTLRFDLGPQVRERVVAFARRHGSTPNLVLLAAFTAFVHRQSGQTDVVIGVPVSGRSDPALHDVVGLFVNTAVLRTDLGGRPTFIETVTRSRASLLDALESAELPFQLLVSELLPERTPSHAPLVQVLFAFHENSPAAHDAAPVLRREFVPTGTAKLDLTLTVNDTGERYEVELEYGTDLFLRTSADRFFDHWSRLLDTALDQPDVPVDELCMAGADERTAVARWSAGSPVEVEHDGLIHDLVGYQIGRRPDATAVVCGPDHLTYRELGERSDRVAGHLRAHGIGPGDLVGVCVSRSLALVVHLLGVLKAGAAYLPLDVDYPAERLAFMLSDAGVSTVIGAPEAAGELPDGPWHVHHGHPDGSLTAGHPPAGGPTARRTATGDDLAYVIYTSGSTGRPKGVEITHRNVARLFASARLSYDVGPDDVWSMVHSASFDVSVWEMWGALSTGGRLVVVPHRTTRNPDELHALVREQAVTVFSQTPSAFVQFEAADERAAGAARLAVRYVIFAGEPLDHGSVRRWAGRHGWDRPRLVNMYGITETTVHNTFRVVTAADLDRARTQIGRPLADLDIHVLDERLRPCPVGVVGEMYVAGAGVARGYLRRPGLTAGRFVADPVGGHTGGRLYRSGDLARWCPDGTLEYAGRADTMVKIRGFRVELTEIEAVLSRHPGIARAAVSLRTDDTGTPQLVGYLVARPEQDITPVRAWLSQWLPEYMLPTRFVELAEIPLTPSCKTDHRRLPAPGTDRPGDAGEFVAPVGDVEQRLAGIWAEALGLDRVGRNDNFFGLGGDSIRSIRVLGAARAAGLTFGLQELFHRPTVAGLARVTTACDRPEATGLGPFELVAEADRAALPDGLEDAYPMVALQVGMVYEMSRDPERLPYHNVDSLTVSAQFDAGAFQRSVDHVVRRHPILRTALALTDYSEPLQLVYAHAVMPVGVDDLRTADPATQERVIRDYVEEQRVTPFDHARPPLFRMHVHRRSDDVFQWTLTEHHGVFDGWSLHSTLSEILRVYHDLRTGRLPDGTPPVAHYRDFVALEREAVGSETAQRFWRDRLADHPDTRLLPWPRTEPAELADEDRFSREWWYATEARQRYGALETLLPDDLCEALRALAGRCGAPMKTLFLAGCLRTIGYATGSRDVLIGVTANGRPEENGGDDVRGLFLNTLAFRQALPDGTWTDLIDQVFAAERDMLPHRRFPMAQLQRLLGVDRLVDVNFVYNHFHVMSKVLSGDVARILDDKISSFTSVRAEPTNFPLNIGVVRDPSSSRVLMAMDFHTDALTIDQVRLLRDYYVRALWDMVEAPDARYLTRPLAGAAERAAVARWSAGTPAGAGRPGLVHDLVQHQIRRRPDAVAVVCGSDQITYRELGERSDRVAASLGTGPGDLVGVCVSRSLDLVVHLLGVLKTGAAYLPLDVDYPAERLAFMLADAGATTVIGTPEHVGGLPRGPWNVHAGARPTGRRPATGDDPAYVIYTSGSTGQPKGVRVPHRAVTRLLRWGEQNLDVGPDDVWSLFHSASFDFSVWEVWGALTTGGRLVVVPYWVSRSPDDFHRLLTGTGVTVLNQTPSAFAQLEAVDARTATPNRLRWVVFGGEALDHASVRRWTERHGWDRPQLVNMYGITETTVHVTARRLTEDDVRGDLTRIGRPVAGLSAHVLDPVLRPVPVGAVGELYVGGDRLALGYAGRPGLTAHRFVADPYAGSGGGRLYRTGDRVRYRPDGELEYVGRADDMVNLRGFRVEPGEIESTLTRHPDVGSATVTVREDSAGRPALVAHVTPGRARPAVAEVRAWLRDRLPEHMLPAHLTVLDRLPLTPSGKVDRRALPAPEVDAAPTGPAPVTAAERILAGLYAEVLGLDQVGVEGSFFELGGDSIMSIQLVSRARRQGLAIRPRDVYELRTVRALAAAATAVTAPAPAASETGAVPLTPVVARARDLGGPMDAFSQTVLVRVPAPTTADHIRAALQVLLDHHAALRMVARVGPAEPWQLEIPPAGSVRAEDCLQVVDVAGLGDTERAARVRAEADAARNRLRPAAGRLVRATWFDAGPAGPHRLALTVHHLAVDGVSWRILLADLEAAGRELAAGRTPVLDPVQTPLRAWALAVAGRADPAWCRTEAPRWARLLDRAEPPIGSRPLDPRADVFERLRTVSRDVPAATAAAALGSAPAAYHAGVDDVLLAALALAVPHWAAGRGRDAAGPLVVDLEGHGRDGLVPEADLSRTVGWFTSIHPVRLDPGPVDWARLSPPEVAAAVKRVKQQLRAVPPRAEFGVLRHLDPDSAATLARFPAPQVAFNYLGRFPAGDAAGPGAWTLAADELGLQGGADPRQPVSHSLEIAAVTYDGTAGPRLRTTWSWPDGLFEEAEISALAQDWVTALAAVVAAASAPSAGGPTPSDLTLAGLTQDEIDDIEHEMSLDDEMSAEQKVM
ncbi:non-ribosomal peptide synthetase [Jidongwangia harbinensis]|uniref:non-ribosomal peptide synthetase n=1 Tax=Jidongwangia harbinensis TaxID=2878561 RepID=UPI001CD975B3|nr:non-ribosomal peptide synthetase [Jidongwangia harbinensis]MCA2211708.1 amino acid adenylation domain-containing protein [Jidongwangia harbinensis]